MSNLAKFGRFGQKVQHLTPVVGEGLKLALVNIAVFEDQPADGKTNPVLKCEVSATGSGKTPEEAEDNALKRALDRLTVSFGVNV